MFHVANIHIFIYSNLSQNAKKTKTTQCNPYLILYCQTDKKTPKSIHFNCFLVFLHFTKKHDDTGNTNINS